MKWFTYILQCCDASYYVGHTHDIEARVQVHNSGQGADYTKHRRPVFLVYAEEHSSKSQAIQREQQIKKWSRKKKQALIEHDFKQLHRLAERRQK